MFGLTNQERLVLLVLASVLLAGTLVNWLAQRYPNVYAMANIIDGQQIYPKVDINKAGIQELIDLPYIGEYTARKIIDYREAHGPFTNTDQLRNVQGIREKNFRKFAPFIKIGKIEKD